MSSYEELETLPTLLSVDKDMKLSLIALLVAGILFLFVSGAHAGELRKYPSPDGMLNALVIPLSKSGESRIEMLSTDGSLLLSQSYASEDGEHGFIVEQADWTPDSKFFVYSLSSSGGHQPWHSPIDFMAASTRSIHRMDDYVGPITDPAFKVVPPNTLSVITGGIPDHKEKAIEVRLSELVMLKHVEPSSSEYELVSRAITNFSQARADAEAERGGPRIETKVLRLRALDNMDDWFIAEAEFDMSEPGIFVIKRDGNRYEVVADWGGCCSDDPQKVISMSLYRTRSKRS